MPQELAVTLAGPYYLHNLKRLVRDLRPLVEADEPVVLKMNLANLTFLGPAALATTTAALMRFHDRHLALEGSTIYLPLAPGIRRFLERMDVFTTAFHEATEDDDQRDNSGFMPCAHFGDDARIREVTLNMLQAIDERSPLDSVAKVALDTALSEVLENVMFHAYTDHGGVAAVQTFKSEIELAIVDLGVGIPESLSRNPDYAAAARADDLTAVRTAIMPNVTSTPDRNRGWGLAFTELLLDNNGGRLEVRSGAGHVQRGAKYADKVSDEPFPGTLVAMRIRRDQPLDYSIAWARLDDATGTLEE